MQYINPNITIRQLLNHTSGIYDVFSNPAFSQALIANQSQVWSPLDLINNFLQPQVFNPGCGWTYSSTNYFLLGMIIEAATGNPYYDEIRNRFLTPLNLISVAIPTYEPLTSPVAHVWI